MIPSQYFEQIIEHGRGIFDECGIWKSVFVNGDGTVLVQCWKFNSPQNIYNLLDQSIRGNLECAAMGYSKNMP